METSSTDDNGDPAMHPLKHLKRVFEHRKIVRRYCFRLGLYHQGLTHDLSKYSPAEFLSGAVYYSDSHSPAAAERRDKGVAKAWLHHKGRNRHHPEYWVDYMVDEEGKVEFGPNRMPRRYVAEMFCDYIAASRIYLGDKYTDRAPYERFMKEKGHKMIHHENSSEFEKMLTVLMNEGEEAAFRYVRSWLRNW